MLPQEAISCSSDRRPSCPERETPACVSSVSPITKALLAAYVQVQQSRRAKPLLEQAAPESEWGLLGSDRKENEPSWDAWVGWCFV